RALPHIVSFYPTELGNGEMPPAALATSASALGIPSNVDIDFIASRGGTIDVTHRLSFDESEGEVRAVWAKADGINVGTKVRDRSYRTPAMRRTNSCETAKPVLLWSGRLLLHRTAAPHTLRTRGASFRPIQGWMYQPFQMNWVLTRLMIKWISMTTSSYSRLI